VPLQRLEQIDEVVLPATGFRLHLSSAVTDAARRGRAR
jgi:hypothetical protein